MNRDTEAIVTIRRNEKRVLLGVIFYDPDQDCLAIAFPARNDVDETLAVLGKWIEWKGEVCRES